MRAPVLVDACVLVPQRLSSLLLTLAEEGLFEPRWSEPILAETERALIDKLGVSRERARHRLAAMRRAFPEAAVHGFAHLEDGLTCDPKDRHVLAAAIAAGADTLVTANLGDFPDASCRPHGVSVLHPDHFLMGLMAHDVGACRVAVEAEARRMNRPPMTARELLTGITSVAPTFANALQQEMLDAVVATGDIEADDAGAEADSP